MIFSIPDRFAGCIYYVLFRLFKLVIAMQWGSSYKCMDVVQICVKDSVNVSLK